MKERFLIRRGDREVRAETLREFESLVRSGAVAPEDLVHDTLTGEWAPARVHPVYRLVDESSDGEAARFGLPVELVEEEDASPEEETRVFIERLERERERERAHGRDPGTARVDDEPFFDVREAASLARPMSEGHATGDAPAGTDARGREASPRDDRGASGARGDGTRRAAAVARRRTLVLGSAVVAVLAVTAAVVHPAFRLSTSPSTSGDEAATGSETPPAPPTDAELRAGAWAGFVERVDSVRRSFSLERVPPNWLEGRYLAAASEHPEVERFWSDYLRYIERVYAEEETLFRDAYLEVLEEHGISGPMRSLRLARVGEDFRAASVERRTRYSGVWELAVTARSLHEILVELEGDITWEPARGERLSADPVVEAAGRDEATQARLDGALDRVLSALYEVADGGRDVREQRPDWLARSLASGGTASP
jgi:hypothetical protein